MRELTMRRAAEGHLTNGVVAGRAYNDPNHFGSDSTAIID